MDMILIQAIGAVGYLALAISYFRKEKKQILFTQIISYIFFTIHFYLLSGITGAICNLIGLFALISIYIFEKYKLKNKAFVVYVFVAILLVVNIITFQDIFSIFPMIASIIIIIAFLESNENRIRAIGIISTSCWLVYSIAYKSYIGIVFQVVTLVDVIIAYLKNRKKDYKKNEGK